MTLYYYGVHVVLTLARDREYYRPAQYGHTETVRCRQQLDVYFTTVISTNGV